MDQSKKIQFKRIFKVQADTFKDPTGKSDLDKAAFTRWLTQKHYYREGVHSNVLTFVESKFGTEARKLLQNFF